MSRPPELEVVGMTIKEQLKEMVQKAEEDLQWNVFYQLMDGGQN
jgi:hypothetical protein